MESCKRGFKRMNWYNLHMFGVVVSAIIFLLRLVNPFPSLVSILSIIGILGGLIWAVGVIGMWRKWK